MTTITSDRNLSEGPSNDWTLAELSHAREALRLEIVRLRAAIAGAEVGSGQKARQYLVDGEDEVYAGTLAAAMGMGSQTADNSLAILDQCETALQRIGQLRYGICDECERPIAKERLLAMPRATLCTKCQ